MREQAEMAKFEAGNDPANHTVAEVAEFLKSDEITGDEYDRVVEAERQGKNRVGIMNGTGVEDATAVAEPMQAPDGSEAAGPNEAATGQPSPADQAKTVDDPQASGDAGLTADQYPEDAPPSLGPDMPQSDAEQDAHDATVANLTGPQKNALPVDAREGGYPARRYTPEEALKEAVSRSTQWSRNR